MIALANEFQMLVRSSTLRTIRRDDKDAIIISVHGPSGTAELEFYKDEFVGMIDTDIVHAWRGMATSSDVTASANKVRELIG